MTLIKQFIWKYGPFSFHISFKFFKCRILPIQCHGSEILGYQYWHCVERSQVDFCQFVLRVGRSISSAGALGKCGRLPIAVGYHKRVIKYWLKLINNDRGGTFYSMTNVMILISTLSIFHSFRAISHLAFHMVKLLFQGYEVKRLRNSFKKFCGRYPDLIGKYQKSVKDMVVHSFLTSLMQWYNWF